MKEVIITSDKTMTPHELFQIFDKQQALSAKKANNAIDRAKVRFTAREKWNKIAQMGITLKYDKIKFVVEGGLGMLDYGDGRKYLGATFSDFEEAICKASGRKSIKWKEA